MPKAGRSPTPGIPRRIKQAEMHARPTAPQDSFKFRAGSTFIGRMTILCEWMPIPESRLACSILAVHLLRMRHLRCKDTRPLHGAEEKRGIAAILKVRRCRTKPA